MTQVNLPLVFSLLPITTEELKNVADEGLTMPPKSTFIEPKLRSGITIYEFLTVISVHLKTKHSYYFLTFVLHLIPKTTNVK